MTHLLCFSIFALQLLTIVYTYDPATCIKCRSTHVCNPPDCFCCRDEMPLGSHKIPQMVFFTFDDAVTPQVAGHYRDLFDSKRKNPNGCPISMTLFISHSNTVYRLVREFYDKGMEIASHSVTHSHPNPQTFLREARKQRLNLANKANIPEKDIVGWRSPFLEPLGDTQPSVLKQLGYEYDATLTVSKKGNADKAVTPFTLDFGWPYDCKIKSCPKKPHTGFWEVPVVSVKDYLNKYDCVYIDGCNNPPPSENLAYKFLWDNFQTYYTTNRAPMGINMHASWFYYPDRKAAMDRFIKKLGTMNDVFVLSVKQVLAWLKHPTPLNKIQDFHPWRCDKANSTIPSPSGSNNAQIRKSVKQNKDKLYQKMAEQRNQWRREHLQRESHRMNFQNGPIIPPTQPGPSVPAIPPLVPNHPMINFWWQPPSGVLPPHLQHELAVRQDMQMRQLEEQRHQEAMERQRMVQERQMRVQAQRRIQEQQRLEQIQRQQQEEKRQRQALLKKQEEARKRQELLQRQKETRKRQELLRKQEEERKRQETLKKQQEQKKRQELLRQQEERRKRQELLIKQEEQRKLNEQLLVKQQATQFKQQKKNINTTGSQSRGHTDPGMLVEYSSVNVAKDNQPSVSSIDIAIHGPPLREVHEQQLIKEKLKLHPGNVAELTQTGKDASSPQSNNFPSINRNGVSMSGSVHDHFHNSPTSTSHHGHHHGEPSIHQAEQSNSKPATNSQLLNNILNYKPSERIKYLHMLSLDELKSLQAELRRRLASDSTTMKPVTAPVSEIPSETTTLGSSDMFQNELTGHTVEATIYQEPNAEVSTKTPPMDPWHQEFSDKASLTVSLPSFSKPPTTIDSADTIPGLYGSDLFPSQGYVPETTFTTTTTVPPPAPTTTTAFPEVVTELANIYYDVTSKITELTTAPTVPTSQETTTTVGTTTTTTAPFTTTDLPITQRVVSTESVFFQTTARPSDINIGSKSLWQISEIFDMSNRMVGEKMDSPPAVQPTRDASLLAANPKSLNLFSTSDQFNLNDVSVDQINQMSPGRNRNKASIQTNNQRPTAFSKLASKPAQFSKSLFSVRGYDKSNPTVGTGLWGNSAQNRVSISIPNIRPTETASLTIGPRNGPSSERITSGIYADFQTTPSTATTTTAATTTTTTTTNSTTTTTTTTTTPAPTTTIPTTVTTPTTTTQQSTISSKPKTPVRQLQQLIQPVNLFEPTFGGALQNPSVNYNVVIPRIASNDRMTQSTTNKQIEIPLVSQSEFLISASERTPGSSCSQEVNCFYPDCVCKSDTTPFGLPTKQLPQIVYITIDGSLNFHTYSKIGKLFPKTRVNPNGCPIKGTLFVTDAGSNYRIADILHKKGLEIGLSGLSSRPQKSGGEVENNIVTLTELITKSTSVSPMDIKGWRSPGFTPVGDVQYELLGNYSLYDSSLVANRQAGSAKLWPFTLDYGWKEDCGERSCPVEDHPGVMEVPILPFVGPKNSSACEYTDGCTDQPKSEQETFDYLMQNFNSYYKSNRAPFAIRLKQIWFHWYYRANLRGLIRFLDTILGYKDVYVSSVSGMLHWVRDPVPLNKINKFQPWKC